MKLFLLDSFLLNYVLSNPLVDVALTSLQSIEDIEDKHGWEALFLMLFIGFNLFYGIREFLLGWFRKTLDGEHL
jgi:hypothetical protein